MRSEASPAAAVPAVPAKRDNSVTTSSWGGPVELYGGQLIHTGGGDGPNLGIGGNMPPPEAEPISPAEPALVTPQVPQGWDIPSRTEGGLTYPASRNPVLPDGKPWPIADHDYIRAMLSGPAGKALPVAVFVPVDGIGPMLAGSTPNSDFPRPPGYAVVTFNGRPQVTYSRGTETGHARDSIEEALRLAASNLFSNISFNRSLSTVTRQTVQSRLRPDVTAEVRPEVDHPYRYHPYESLSPGQVLENRQNQLKDLPDVELVDGRNYKRSPRLSPEICRILGVRYLCS